MYNDQNLYLINEWSDILNHDIILKVISNKNTPPKDFSKLLSLSNQLHLEFYIEVNGKHMFYLGHTRRSSVLYNFP